MMHFNAHAAQWEANPHHQARTRAIADAIRTRIPLSATMRSVEVGCGTGLLSFALHQDLGPITLTDTSQGMIDVLSSKIAAQGLTTMTPLLRDLNADPLPAGSADFVFLQMALHHMVDLDATLGGFHAMLAAGGHLAVADMDAEDGSFHGEGFVGHNGFDRAELGDRLRDAGFADVAFETVYQMPREFEGVTRHFPVFLMVARKA